jgi:hypothetical protein
MNNILNLDIIVSNSESRDKLLLFCCGIYGNNNYFTNTNKFFLIGKICSCMKPEIENYINYLLMIRQNNISIKFHPEIINIHNINVILNSSDYREPFISFLCGLFENHCEDWIDAEQFGNEYIMGKLIEMNNSIVFIFCNHLLKHTSETDVSNALQQNNVFMDN